MASKVFVSMALVLLGALVVTAAAVPVAASEPSGLSAAEATGAMPADVRAFLDAHPASIEAVRRAEAKARGQQAWAASVPAGKRAELDGVVGESHGVARSVQRPDAADEIFTTVIDDFEGSILDPNLWTVGDLDGGLFGEHYWGLSQCRASQGVQGLWSVGGGKDGSLLGCNDLYPSGANSYAMLAMDMSHFATPPSQLDLLVDYWLNTRIFDEAGVVPDGLFISWLRPLPDGSVERVVLKAITSQYPERFFNDPIRLDLVQATEVYEPYRTFDLSKEPQLLIEFLFMSRDAIANEPAPTTFVGGVFIDNIRIMSDVQPSLASVKAPPAWTKAGQLLPVGREQE